MMLREFLEPLGVSQVEAAKRIETKKVSRRGQARASWLRSRSTNPSEESRDLAELRA